MVGEHQPDATEASTLTSQVTVTSSESGLSTSATSGVNLLAGDGEEDETGCGCTVEVVRSAELTFFRLLPSEQTQWYFDLGRAVVKAAVRNLLEELMANEGGHKYLSDFARRYVAQGAARGVKRGARRGASLS